VWSIARFLDEDVVWKVAWAIAGMAPRTAMPEAADKKRRRAALGGVVIGNPEKCGCPVYGAEYYMLPQPLMGATDIE
jgi:hypothetical protein